MVPNAAPMAALTLFISAYISVQADQFEGQLVPPAVQARLGVLRDTGARIDWISFAPPDGWVIIANGRVHRADIPRGAEDQLTFLERQRAGVRAVVFSPNREWIILFGANNTVSSAGVPTDAVDKLSSFRAEGLRINSVALGPNNSWAVLAGRPGDQKFHVEGDGSLYQRMRNQFVRYKTSNFRFVTFSTTPGTWLILWDETNYWIEGNREALDWLRRKGDTQVKCFGFVPGGGWIAITP